MQADVFELALVDRRQRLGHAVDERLDADEAAFEANVIDILEQRTQLGRCRGGQVDGESRQERVEQRGLARPQRVAFAPAEERTGSFVLFAHAPLSKTTMPGTRPGIA